MNLTEIKINNLISKRQLAINMFGIVAAGIVGLTFMQTTIKSVILLLAGIYVAIVLINNYVVLNYKIDKLIKDMEETK